MRAVGLTEAVELEKTPVDIASGDLYLLCSDGLDKMQTNEQIAKMLKAGDSQPLATLAQTLINAANEAGGKDNVTVVLVKAGDLSGAPNTIDADEEEEEKTFAAPATPPVEAATPANFPAQAPAMPDTADLQAVTPHTPASSTENPPSEKAAADKPATPAPASVPAPTPAANPPPKAAAETAGAKMEAKPETKAGPAPEKKKSFPLGATVTVAAVAVAAGAGIWFATGSKPKTEKPAAVLPAKPAAPQPPAANPVPAPDPAQAAMQEAGRAALKNAQAAFDNHDYKNAAALAAAALQKIPGDAAAVKLQADARAQLKVVDAWRDALGKAQAAFDNKDYKTAAARAAEALQQIPNEQAAAKLRDSAQQYILDAANSGPEIPGGLDGGAGRAQEQQFYAGRNQGQGSAGHPPQRPGGGTAHPANAGGHGTGQRAPVFCAGRLRHRRANLPAVFGH